MENELQSDPQTLTQVVPFSFSPLLHVVVCSHCKHPSGVFLQVLRLVKVDSVAPSVVQLDVHLLMHCPASQD